MDIILDVVAGMADCLSREQTEKLKLVMAQCLKNYDVVEKSTEIALPYQTENIELLKRYFAWKATEGMSVRTLKQYKFIVDKALDEMKKPIPEITEDDVFMYLSMMKYRGAKDTYLRNVRNYLSAMFTWMHSKNLIKKNPMKGISPIKVDKVIKEEFTDVELEQLRRATENERDLAIVELLYASGMRVSEMEQLNRSDIDMINKVVKVYGKGGKERRVYISNTAAYYLEMYLKTRKDSDFALFVSNRKPYERLEVSAIQRMLRELGKKTGIEKVHPHRFRRTLATNLLRKGMTIEEVSQILGHEKLDTTMVYCNINQDAVKNQYMRIMCA